ncbi:Multidrug resistance protein ABC Superfamily, partial [Phytophthora palmivora]
MAYVKVFWVDLAVVLAGSIVYVLALGLQTYVTRALLEFLNGEENVFGITSGYWLMVMMTGSSLVAVCVLNYLFFIDSRIGSNMRTLTMSLVYDKALRLSSAARLEYTTGEILTLMSVDTERVFTAMVQGPWLVMGPLAFVVSCVLIGFLLDFYAALAGAIVLTAVAVISIRQGDHIADLQRRLLQVIDERVKVTSETLQGIRVMKFYAWEDSLAQRVEKLRVREVSLLRKFHSYQVINTVMLFITPTFLSGATLGVYVLIRHTITVVEAFTLVAMVNIARAPLNQLPQAVAGLSKAKIAYARIDAFLASSEVPVKSALLPNPNATKDASSPNAVSLLSSNDNADGYEIGRGYISIRDGMFEWPGNNVVVVTMANDKDISIASDSPDDKFEVPAASSVDSSIKQGFQIKGISMEIERGSLVMIVGKVGSGKSSLVNAILGEMPRVSGVLEIGGQVAYVSQDTWIRNATLRDNILFEQDFDAERYAQVLEASQLAMDLKALPNGDSTEIDHIVVMQDGMVASQGSYEQVLDQFPQLTMDLINVDGSDQEFVKVSGSPIDAKVETQIDNETCKEATAQSTQETDKKEALGRLIRAEDRVKGKVSGRVYKTYFDETGFNGIVVMVVIIFAYIAGQAARTIVDWWPGHWARNMP